MYNITNEQIIIDCALSSPTLLPVIMNNIKEIDFYEPSHVKIFSLIKELFEKQITVSISSVMKLATDKNTDINLLNILHTWTGGDIKPYIESLQDDSNRRQIHFLLQEKQEQIVNRNNSVDSIYSDVDSKIQKILANQISPITMMSDMATGDIYDLGSNRIAKMTGFSELDKMIWGISAGELIVLAGRTSEGKSAITGNMATYIAKHYQDHVLWFSLEMPKEQMRRRWVAQESEYDNFKIKIKKYDSDADIEKVRKAMEKVDSMSIGIIDRKFEINEITGIARRFSHRHKISVIVVDYLQLVINYIKGVTTATMVADTVNKLKNMAMDLEVPVICLSQFNRTSSPEEYPEPSWLKESSAIEQAADMIWFIHRYTDKQKEKFDGDDAEYLRGLNNLYRFIEAKNRDGKSNFHFDMQFFPDITTFRCI